MHEDILIINDFAGYGRVSTQAMIPVLSHYGHHCYALPTAIVSNATEYGICEIMDTSSYMRSAYDTWKKLGFRFTNLAIGFINSHEQVDIINEIINDNSPQLILVDPIMADAGILYEGMYHGVIDCNKSLASKASLLIPNVTEACMISDMFVERSRSGEPVMYKPTLSSEEIHQVAEKLVEICRGDIVITGCEACDVEKPYNYIYERRTDSYIISSYKHIPARFTGTGDIFSGILASELMNGSDLEHSVKTASDFISRVLSENLDVSDRYDLHFEKSLHYLDSSISHNNI